jgi:hypothetical protein
MKLATETTDQVEHLGVDDFSFRRGRTFGTVLVDLHRHQILDPRRLIVKRTPQRLG